MIGKDTPQGLLDNTDVNISTVAAHVREAAGLPQVQARSSTGAVFFERILVALEISCEKCGCQKK
ncbi:hypothetical protein [Falsiroseomonas sp. HW251]|uniref:hypothetical protein n=1 Tax=Falsiroseomonas sp. HW251 TaxID=3390998 RepID=UPI003D310225